MHKAIDTLPVFANKEVRIEFETYHKNCDTLSELDSRIHMYKERISQLENHSLDVAEEMRSNEKMVRINPLGRKSIY